MRKIVKYKIVADLNICDLNEKINNMLATGWDVLGPVVVAVNAKGYIMEEDGKEFRSKTCFLQTMVRYND